MKALILSLPRLEALVNLSKISTSLVRFFLPRGFRTPNSSPEAEVLVRKFSQLSKISTSLVMFFPLPRGFRTPNSSPKGQEF
jgi:hypothetical protein